MGYEPQRFHQHPVEIPRESLARLDRWLYVDFGDEILFTCLRDGHIRA
jgi:hypothetical protein